MKHLLQRIWAKIIEIVKAAITKFSKINAVQYVGIATLIATTWSEADLINPAYLLMITGAGTLFLYIWQSSKQMVETGFNLGWTVAVSGLLMATVGFLDTFMNMTILTDLFGTDSKLVMMAYMALVIIIRTGFTNQKSL